MWFRDGGMNTAHLAMTGWPDPAHQHVPFALANPNVSLDEPEGHFFGQVMGGSITKWQEDGLFYVVWPAFLHWTQTGDDSFVKGDSLRVMEEALDWLERYSFDPERGLFGRYYFCETPLTGSRDYGWDNATGAPTDRFESVYEGRTITRSYDVYVNALNHAVYLMLSAMETGPRGRRLPAEGPGPGAGDGALLRRALSPPRVRRPADRGEGHRRRRALRARSDRLPVGALAPALRLRRRPRGCAGPASVSWATSCRRRKGTSSAPGPRSCAAWTPCGTTSRR